MKSIILLVLLVSIAASTKVPEILKSKLTRPAALDGRIIDGDIANSNAAPFLVSISLSSLAYGHACSGTIIAKDWVVTVAHCISELKFLTGEVLGLPVYAGLTNRAQISNAQVRIIDFVFSHKGFNGREGSDDIALIHVSEAFEFSATVKPAILPYAHEQFGGRHTMTYGWGLTDNEATSYSNDLLVGHGDVLNSTDCINALPLGAPLNGRQVCAATSACYGDGGNPLVIVNTAANFAELVGITSWGYLPCGYDNRPAVYVAVAEYVEWIAEVQWAYYILH